MTTRRIALIGLAVGWLFSSAAANGVPAATQPAISFEISPNTWTDARLKFVLPADLPDAKWVTTDGYSGATYRSRTGTVLWRTGVASDARGLSPGYYSNATLEWAPADGEARVVEYLGNWGGGSYGHGKLLEGFGEYPMPAPRHVYDAFDYVESQDAVYMMLGSSWKTGLTGASEQARAQLAVDDRSTWKYCFADGRWRRIDGSIKTVWPNVSQHGPSMQPWPEANRILCFSDRGYAEFDLKTETWEKVEPAGKRPDRSGGGPGSSTWDSKRQLWVIRRGPEVNRFDPRTRQFDTLPPAYEVTEDKHFSYNRYLGTGIAYIPRHDAYLIYCPSGDDTYVYRIEKGTWTNVKGGRIALPYGNLVHDPKTDLTVLVYQHKTFRFRYVPEKDGAAGPFLSAAAQRPEPDGRAEAAGNEKRRAAAQALTAQVRGEVQKLSPALLDTIDWTRLATTLTHAGQDPDRSLARAAALCQVYHLADWPVRQRLSLLGDYLSDPAAAVRRLAVDLLACDEAVQAGSLPLLARVADADADPVVRVQAAHLLLQHNDPAGWKPILTALVSDDPAVRGSPAMQSSPQRDAKHALMQLTLEQWGFGSNAARLPEPLRLTPETLKRATDVFVMRDNVIRRTVVEVIGLDRNRTHLPLLLERLAKEDAWTVHRSIYVSLGYLGDAKAIPALTDGLAEPKLDRTGRTAPATGLAVLGDPAALGVLIEAAQDPARLQVVAAALSRAFDPDHAEDDGAMPLVPDAGGRMVRAWVPAASSDAAPMVPDGRGGQTRAAALSADDLHAAWTRFFANFGPRLRWDPTRCRYTVAPRDPDR